MRWSTKQRDRFVRCSSFFQVLERFASLIRQDAVIHHVGAGRVQSNLGLKIVVNGVIGFGM
jgi:hypothetical protein